METKVILISGKARHGKDTSAEYFKEALEDQGKSVLIFHYGDLLKFICTKYFGWNGEKDDYGRTLLQKVGTDIVRNREPHYWVDFAAKFIKLFYDEWDYIIIPDTRFPNEIKRLREQAIPTYHIRVSRGKDFNNGLTEEQNGHISETALDKISPDYWLDNTGTLEELKVNIIEHIKNPYFTYKFY